MQIKVKEILLEERPREKAMQYGIENLSNRDLLAILLRFGYQGVSALQLADEMLNTFGGIGGISESSIEELMTIKGVSSVKAIEIKACFELAKRSIKQVEIDKVSLNSPNQIANYLMHKIGHKKQEHFVVLYLDTKNQLLYEETLFIGSLNTSVVHAREIFRLAIQKASARIVIVHNHPSGECIPSQQDILVTNSIYETGKLIGIPLLDHLIIGNNSYFSFKEKHMLS